LFTHFFMRRRVPLLLFLLLNEGGRLKNIKIIIIILTIMKRITSLLFT